jgi:hypothetical protein
MILIWRDMSAAEAQKFLDNRVREDASYRRSIEHCEPDEKRILLRLHKEDMDDFEQRALRVLQQEKENIK